MNQIRSGQAVEAMVHEQRHPGVEADRTRLESADREVETRQAARTAVEAENLAHDAEAEGATTVGQDDRDAAEGPVGRLSCDSVRPGKSLRAGWINCHTSSLSHLAVTLRRWASLPLVSSKTMNDPVYMFAIDCPQHGARVLVGPRRIRAFHNTDRGILLSVECYCGHRVALQTGRRGHITPRSGSSLIAVA